LRINPFLTRIKRDRKGQIASNLVKGKNPETVEISGFLAVLTLAELRSAACGFETVLFTLFHSRVAGQQTGGLESGAVVLVHDEQRAGDAVADGAGLAGNAAAGNGGLDVDLADGAGGDQGLADDELQGLETEVIVDVTAVDRDDAAAVGNEVDAGDRGLSASGAVHIGLLGLVSSHVLLSSFSAIPNFGLLGGVVMLGPAENAQALELPVGDGVLLQHAADGETHGKLGLVGHQVLVLGLLQTAGVTGVGTVVLLLQLLAGQDGVFGVDDDDVVTAVNMGGVVGFQLAAQDVGGESGGLAQGLAGRVKDVPLTGNGLLGYHGSRHS